MRKSLLKSLVGVAVVGAAMAITSVAAMAATYSYTPDAAVADSKFDETVGKSVADGFFKLNNSKTKFKTTKSTKYDPFDISTVYSYRLQTGGKDGSISFNLSETGSCRIEFTTGSKNTERSVTLSGPNDYKKTVSSSTYQLTPLVAENLAAGEYTITWSAADTFSLIEVTTGSDAFTAPKIADTIQQDTINKTTDYVAIDAKNGKSYIIHPVSKSDLTTGNNLTLCKAVDASKITATTTDKVYEAVEFSDKSSVTAASLGVDYIYAVEFTDGARFPDPYDTTKKDADNKNIYTYYSWVID